MNSEMLLNSLLISDANSLGLFDIFLGLVLPFSLSFPATWIYQKAQTSSNYSAAFIQSFFLFASLSSIMTMIIGNNIARAFGLIGALSIIRFRNALKSPIDAVYIFWALAIGMACGTGFYLAAIVVTLCISVMALSLKWLHYGEKRHIESIVRVHVQTNNEQETVEKIEKIFAAKSLMFNRINIIFNSNDNNKTYIYHVATLDSITITGLQNEIKSQKGVGIIQTLNSSPTMFAA